MLGKEALRSCWLLRGATVSVCFLALSIMAKGFHPVVTEGEDRDSTTVQRVRPTPGREAAGREGGGYREPRSPYFDGRRWLNQRET